MRLSELRAGWRSEFIRHQFDAQVLERSDCIVVRTPANPSYYWGNCLVLPRAPLDTELAYWRGRFDEEITQHQPACQHVAMGVDQADEGQDLPAWRADGFEIHRTRLLGLRAGELRVADKPPQGRVVVRAIAFPGEVNTIIDLECLDDMPFELSGYRRYRQAQFERHARMHAAGQLQWFGLWCDGTLAACCGLMRAAALPGALARFQHVFTHPQWRRRGLCTALVTAASQYAQQQWQAEQVLLMADPSEVAIHLYKSLGYSEVESHWSLQRFSPQDRPA
jgi:ribosomal protein S18 acetylase RimI-like enzyme